MPDREKVIKGLECAIGIRGVKNCDNCPYDNDFNCLGCDIVMRDALALLREQGPREPHYTTLEYLVNGTKVIVHHPECPRCFENGLALWDAEIERGQAYCKRCGQAVKWDGNR